MSTFTWNNRFCSRKLMLFPFFFLFFNFHICKKRMGIRRFTCVSGSQHNESTNIHVFMTWLLKIESTFYLFSPRQRSWRTQFPYNGLISNQAEIWTCRCMSNEPKNNRTPPQHKHTSNIRIAVRRQTFPHSSHASDTRKCVCQLLTVLFMEQFVSRPLFTHC
jgi:hypothetical protein